MSDRYNEIRPCIVPCISKGKSTSESEHTETRNLPVLHAKFGENLIGPANSMGTKINIRHRNQEHVARSFSRSPNPPGRQGIAERPFSKGKQPWLVMPKRNS